MGDCFSSFHEETQVVTKHSYKTVVTKTHNDGPIKTTKLQLKMTVSSKKEIK